MKNKMRMCPKCNKRELDVTTYENFKAYSYFFSCWNCGFECSKKEAEENEFKWEEMVE